MIQIGDPGGGGGGEHRPINPMTLFKLANALRDDAEDGEWVTARILESTADFEEVPLTTCYAALPVAYDLTLRPEHDVSVEVCLAGCQTSGAIKLLEALLALKDERAAAGLPTFDVIPRGCLDDCDRAPLIRTLGPAGTFLHPKAQVSELSAIIEAVCD